MVDARVAGMGYKNIVRWGICTLTADIVGDAVEFGEARNHGELSGGGVRPASESVEIHITAGERI